MEQLPALATRSRQSSTFDKLSSSGRLVQAVRDDDGAAVAKELADRIKHSAYIATLWHAVRTSMLDISARTPAAGAGAGAGAREAPAAYFAPVDVGEIDTAAPTAAQCTALEKDILCLAPDGSPLVLYAVRYNRVHALESLLAFYPVHGSGAVAVADVQGNWDVFTEAIQAGSDIMFRMLLRSAQGLVMTARTGALEDDASYSTERLEWVRNVDPNYAEHHVTDLQGTLLYEVCTQDMELSAFVAELVRAKAKIADAENEGDTPIHAACAKGHVNIVMLLLEHGTPVNSENQLQQTPLHLAFRYGKQAVARLLISRGASLRATDIHGRTPLHYAFRELNKLSDLLMFVDGHLETAQGVTAELKAGVEFVLSHEIEVSDEDQRLWLADRRLRSVMTVLGDCVMDLRKRQQKPPGIAKVLKEGAKTPAWRLGEIEEHVSPTTSKKVSQDAYLRYWSFWGRQFRKVPKEVVGGVFIAHIHDKLINEREGLDAVVELAVEAGADLTARDMDAEECFSAAAKQAWYDRNAHELATEAWKHSAGGFKSPQFSDPRTQMAVERVWNIRIRGKMWMRLCCWVVYILLLMGVGVVATGRNSFYAHYFQSGIEESILFEEADIFATGFSDLRNTEDYYNWIENVLTPAIYEGPMTFRNGTGEEGFPQPMQGDSIRNFNYFIGRPRIRTVRTKPTKCSFTASGMDRFQDQLCFTTASEAEIDTRPFTTGTLRWEHKEADVPTYRGLIDKYPGGGFWRVLPKTEDEWVEEVKQMIMGDFIDMNTRLIIFEFCVFNPGLHLFLTARLALEFTASGAVVPTHFIDSVALIPYNSTGDLWRLVTEALLALFFIWYIMDEVSRMFEPWPRDPGGPPVPHVRFKYPALACQRNRRDDEDDDGNMYKPDSDESDSESDTKPVTGLVAVDVPAAPAVVNGGAGAGAGAGAEEPSAATNGGAVVAEEAPSLKKQESSGIFGAGKQLLGGGKRMFKTGGSVVFKLRKNVTGGTRKRLQSIMGNRMLRMTKCRFDCCGYKLMLVTRTFDTGIERRPYFYDSFNWLDLCLMGSIIALVVLHIYLAIRATKINWSERDTFVPVYDVANFGRSKVYFMALVVFLSWLKTLEYLRVNRNLSTFILVIRGMLAKLTGFFVVLFFCLVAFAGFDYIAFGFMVPESSTIVLAVLTSFSGALGNIDVMHNWENARFVQPIFVIGFAIFVLILLFNLLIAVMSEAYESIKDSADAAWCFTQFRMIDEVEKQQEWRRSVANTRRWCSCCRGSSKTSPEVGEAEAEAEAEAAKGTAAATATH